jgi:hypothetical protein
MLWQLSNSLPYIEALVVEIRKPSSPKVYWLPATMHAEMGANFIALPTVWPRLGRMRRE